MLQIGQGNNPPPNPLTEITRLAREIQSSSTSLLNFVDNANYQAVPPLMRDINADLVALRPLIVQQAPQLDPNVWQGFPVAQNNDGGNFFIGLVLGAIAGFWLASQSG
ncbi:MAG: hypothetical protein IAE85_11700 [Anaerolinea sp.]|nr:hypothetical protein [Anaerolinea sp.]